MVAHFHKWKSELPISDYVEILTGAEMKSNVSANDVKQVKKKPSTRKVDFTPRVADMKQTLDKWINQRVKYENSKDGQRLARYRGAVHSRIYVHLKALMRTSGIDLVHLPASTAAVLNKVKNVT